MFSWGTLRRSLQTRATICLIRAFAQVRKKILEFCRLLLAGDGPERERLEALVAELQLPAAVVFMGFVDDVEACFCRESDLFVFPGARGRATDRSAGGYLAHGLPSVGLARGGVPEVCCRTAAMVFWSPCQVARSRCRCLAAAIIRLLSDPAEARKMGEAARETITTRFSADHMVDQTVQVYDQAIAAASKSRARNNTHVLKKAKAPECPVPAG